MPNRSVVERPLQMGLEASGAKVHSAAISREYHIARQLSTALGRAVLVAGGKMGISGKDQSAERGRDLAH